MAAATILVSEVDPDVRRLLVMLIERLGHEAVVLDPDLVVPPPADLLLVEPESTIGLEHARLVGPTRTQAVAVALREAVIG
jgi:hypothetical protein